MAPRSEENEELDEKNIYIRVWEARRNLQKVWTLSFLSIHLGVVIT